MKKLIGEGLRRFGYVHVTGLQSTVRTIGTEESACDKIQVKDISQLGTHDGNNGMCVAITLNGEVWLADDEVNRLADGAKTELEGVLAEVCPKGSGAFVPCSNGERIPFRQLMARIANPYWIGSETHVEAQYDIYLTR